jgi:hypothetical protein
VVLGTAFGSTVFSGGDPDPICIPSKPCQKGIKGFDGDPIPVCRPNLPCPVPKQ